MTQNDSPWTKIRRPLIWLDPSSESKSEPVIWKVERIPFDPKHRGSRVEGRGEGRGAKRVVVSDDQPLPLAA